MIESMTGYGSATNDKYIVEIRSLNHRYLEIFMKMPPYMLQHEIPLRNLIKSRFERGRFDVMITLKDEKSFGLKINREYVRNVYIALKQVQDELSIPGQIDMDTITGYRDYILEDKQEYDESALFDTFQKALSSLEEMRIKEGSFIEKDIAKGVDKIMDINNEIKRLVPLDYERKRTKFIERIKSIVTGELIDPNRIYQEIVIMGEKLDISEELSRIESHISQIKNVINNEKVVGKKLDFLLQEINREVNTIVCKSANEEISRLVIEMKSEIEKIREQAQNIQ